MDSHLQKYRNRLDLNIGPTCGSENDIVSAPMHSVIPLHTRITCKSSYPSPHWTHFDNFSPFFSLWCFHRSAHRCVQSTLPQSPEGLLFLCVRSLWQQVNLTLLQVIGTQPLDLFFSIADVRRYNSSFVEVRALGAGRLSVTVRYSVLVLDTATHLLVNYIYVPSMEQCQRQSEFSHNLEEIVRQLTSLPSPLLGPCIQNTVFILPSHLQ